MNKKWIGTWGSSQLIAANETVPPTPGLAGNTYRQSVRVSIGGECLKITLDGMKGGHSGVEINKNRVNASILMGRVLNHLRESSARVFTAAWMRMEEKMLPLLR